MSEEKRVSGEAIAAAEPRKKYWPIVLSAFAVILIAGLIAFLHWHESPSFCNVICHQPMDRYVEGYYSEDMSLSVAQHADAGVTCLGCHWPQAKMLDLVHEVVMWSTDGFTDPLTDRRTELVTDEFCVRCHDGSTQFTNDEGVTVTAQTKESATEGWLYNPHALSAETVKAADTTGMAAEMHAASGIFVLNDDGSLAVDVDGNYVTECSACHTVHKISTIACAECHSGYFNEENGTLPANWAVPTDNRAALTEALGDAAALYDPHAMLTEHADMFANLTTFHATAGENGAITCTDCHKSNGENVFICAQCHSDKFASVTKSLEKKGWTIPTDNRAALAKNMLTDPHQLMALPSFEEAAFHQTAGADGGMITCTDCHKDNGENTFICAQCHASDFESITSQLTEKGWTLPEAMVDVPMIG
ncbi:MAG: hypothetical protein IKE43_00175 [Coriobacteriales bacterium]|nr:hypothetical protein [Coriobacteriales bacterium]